MRAVRARRVPEPVAPVRAGRGRVARGPVVRRAAPRRVAPRRPVLRRPTARTGVPRASGPGPGAARTADAVALPGVRRPVRPSRNGRPACHPWRSVRSPASTRRRACPTSRPPAESWPLLSTAQAARKQDIGKCAARDAKKESAGRPHPPREGRPADRRDQRTSSARITVWGTGPPRGVRPCGRRDAPGSRGGRCPGDRCTG